MATARRFLVALCLGGALAGLVSSQVALAAPAVGASAASRQPPSAARDGAAVRSAPRAAPRTARQGTFTDVTFPGAADTLVLGISAAGELYGQYLTARGHTHGFTDTKGTFTKVSDPKEKWNSVVGILSDGAIVGSSLVNGTYYVGWIERGGKFTLLRAPKALDKKAHGEPGGTSFNSVTPGGRAVGDYLGPDGRFHGFVFHKGKFTKLDFPGNKGQTFLTAITAGGGTIAGQVERGGFYDTFFEHHGTFTTMNDPLAPHVRGAFTYVFGFAPQTGEAVGAWRAGSTGESAFYNGFVLSGGTFTPFSDPAAGTGPGDQTIPTGATSQGIVVGTYVTSGQGITGFVFTPGVG